MPDLAELSERVARLEDERALLDLLYRYGHCIDYGLREEWVDCFTPDGVFDIRICGDRQVVIEGREALRGFIAHHTAPPEARHKHLLVEPRIEFGEDRARITSYFVRINAEDGRPDVVAFGRYLDVAERCDDGRWRLRERLADSDAFDDSRQPGTWKKL